MRRTAIIRSKQPPVGARADRPGPSGAGGGSAARVQARRPVTLDSAGLALQRAAGNAAAARLLARRGRRQGARSSWLAVAGIQREVKQLPANGMWYSTLDTIPPTFFAGKQDAEARDRELQRLQQERRPAQPELGSQPRPTPPEGEPAQRPLPPPRRPVASEPKPQPVPPGLRPTPQAVPPGPGPSQRPEIKPRPVRTELTPPQFGLPGRVPPPRRAPPELPSMERGPGQTAEQPVTSVVPSARPVVPPARPVVPPARPVVPPRLPPTPPTRSPVAEKEVEHVSRPPNRPQPALPVRAQLRSVPQGAPRRPAPSAQGPLWRDIPRDVQAALEEAYVAHQRSAYPGHNELYENWYKQSAKKGSQRPGSRQIEEYEAQLRHHVPQVGAPVPGESYRYLDQAGQLPAVRIYVNPLPEHAAEVFANVVKLARGIPGYFGSKIGDASVAHTSRDVFVLYLDDTLASDGDALGRATVKALGDYHRDNEEKLADEVPRLTRPVLKGVSIGAEPPGGEELATALSERPIGTRATTPEGEPEEHHLPGSWSGAPQLSFSTYRAQLIYEALQSTHDVESYRLRILDNFAIAGIDANAPYLQEKLPSARVLYRLGMVYRTIRLTDVTLDQPRRQGEAVMFEGLMWTVDDVNRLARPTSYMLSRAEQVPEPDA